MKIGAMHKLLFSNISENMIRGQYLKQDLKIIESKPLNTRAKLDLGKGCNRHCSFCYYETQLSSKDWLIPDNARTLVGNLLDNGITQIELSGGEPTMSPYYFDIIEVIKDEFYKRDKEHYITIVTNGAFGKDHSNVRKYCKDLKEVLISLHGTEENHNKIVKSKVAFEYIINVINYLRLSKIITRMNFVVVDKNLDTEAINMLYDFIESKRIQQLNLLPVNYWSDAESQKGQINLNEQQIQIEKFLFKYENAYATNFLNDIGFGSVQKEWSGINIRYHSYCHLNPRYHRYIKTHYDHIYDLKDWNKIYYPRDTEPEDLKLSTPGLKFEEIYDPKPITFENSIKQASKDRLVSHYKEDSCRKCEYYLICDGFKK